MWRIVTSNVIVLLTKRNMVLSFIICGGFLTNFEFIQKHVLKKQILSLFITKFWMKTYLLLVWMARQKKEQLKKLPFHATHSSKIQLYSWSQFSSDSFSIFTHVVNSIIESAIFHNCFTSDECKIVILFVCDALACQIIAVTHDVRVIDFCESIAFDKPLLFNVNSFVFSLWI